MSAGERQRLDAVSGRREAESPMGVVRAWWQAIQNEDLDALGELVAEDHVSTGGPTGRTVGRAAVRQEAADFLADGAVDDWEVRDVIEREHGGVVICSYAWEETGQHSRQPFVMSGLATDVLTWTGTTWVIAAHHTSVNQHAEMRA